MCAVNQAEQWLSKMTHGGTATGCLGRTSQRETIVSRLCDAVGGISAASRWGALPRCHAPDRKEDVLRRMSAAHTDPSLVDEVALG